MSRFNYKGLHLELLRTLFVAYCSLLEVSYYSLDENVAVDS